MTITIGRRPVGPGSPVLVIAEAGVNHNGDAGLAHRLVAAAASAEADAVKFQTFDPDELATPAAAKAAYQEGSAGKGQREMLRALVLPTSAWRELKEDAESRGLIFLSTPFDMASLRILVEMRVSALKVSSGDLDNTSLLRQIAGAGKPVLLSTGMATLGEVSRALSDLGAARSRTIILHCVSAYPAPLEECNLRAIRTMARAFGIPVGFSDHTLGIAVPVAAVSLGACVIEKHLTLDTDLPGPDHRSSLEPAQFATMVQAIRAAETALGASVKKPTKSELVIRRVARRSLVASRDLPARTMLTEDMLVARRPATGLPPTSINLLVGKVLKRSLSADEPLRWDDVQLA